MEAKQSWNRFLTPAREEDLEDLYKEVMGTGSANTQTEEKPFISKRQKREARKWEYQRSSCLQPIQSA